MLRISIMFGRKKKKRLGAVAGGIVAESVKRYAQKKGLYVLVQSGESVNVAETAKDFKAREWCCLLPLNGAPVTELISVRFAGSPPSGGLFCF
ncbi:hypothetical protein ACYULU_03645 [Breznakiellaceae bacterium SP9]